MIKIAESWNDLAAISETPFGCKIRSVASAYGLDESFAQFWVQKETGTAIAKVDDAVVIDDREADFDELAQFLRMLDIRAVSAPESAAQKLGFPVTARGEIMVCGNAAPVPAHNVTEPGLREIYALMQACESDTFPVPEFEPFYMDMSFRLRHGAGAAVGILRDGTLASFALCSALTETSAVITAVATHPRFRRTGCGREALSELIARLGRTNNYIFRADGENEAFYRSMGFAPCGRWAEMRI